MRFFYKVLMAFFALAIVTSPAWAATKEGDKEVGGQVSIATSTSSVDGGDTTTDTTTSILGSFGYFTSKQLQIGGQVFRQVLTEEDFEAGFTFLEGFVKYHFNPDTEVVPYVGAVLGTVSISATVDGNTETGSGTTMGVMAGVKFFMSADLSINAEYSIRNFTVTIADSEAQSTTNTALLGLSYYFH